MCYSNCKNENFHGECTKRIDKNDMSLHCFEGFQCSYCEEIFSDTDEMMETEKSEQTICLDCQEKYSLTECQECGYIAEKEEMNEFSECPDCEKNMFKR